MNEYRFTFDSYTDRRGALTISTVNGGMPLPFNADRVFWITGVPNGESRASHAHTRCYEALCAVHGRFKVKIVGERGNEETIQLDNPLDGVFIPPNTWCEIYDFSPDAVCLCLASGAYDPEGYINDYETYVRLVVKSS